MDGLPETRAYHEQALSLPMFPTIGKRDVERVVREVRAALDAG